MNRDTVHSTDLISFLPRNAARAIHYHRDPGLRVRPSTTSTSVSNLLAKFIFRRQKTYTRARARADIVAGAYSRFSADTCLGCRKKSPSALNKKKWVSSPKRNQRGQQRTWRLFDLLAFVYQRAHCWIMSLFLRLQRKALSWRVKKESSFLPKRLGRSGRSTWASSLRWLSSTAKERDIGARRKKVERNLRLCR